MKLTHNLFTPSPWPRPKRLDGRSGQEKLLAQVNNVPRCHPHSRNTRSIRRAVAAGEPNANSNAHAWVTAESLGMFHVSNLLNTLYIYLTTCIVKYYKPECGPMPNLMVALPNVGGALCSTPQTLADAHY